MLKYKRILLKLSGEALAGTNDFGFSHSVLESFLLNKFMNYILQEFK